MTDNQTLERELDRIKYKFLQNEYALYGSLLCTLPIYWNKDINPPTAQNRGDSIHWHPEFFQKSTKEENLFILAHELEHSIRLHSIRIGDRDPKIWNYACDIKINEHLISNGFLSPESAIVANKFGLDYDPDMTEEDIYDFLLENAININIINDPLAGDIQGPADGTAEVQTQINQLVNAVERAKSMVGAGNIPGEIEKLINEFTEVKIPWHELLVEWCNKLSGKKYHMSKRNRRFNDVYVPGRKKIRNKIESIYCYFDVSGSMGDEELSIVNSNMKYIKDCFNPVIMKIICFDTRITKIVEFQESDVYSDLKIMGGGGTYLDPVRKHIQEENPELAIILSDLECYPMDNTENGTSFIWLKIGNNGFNPKFGKVIQYDY